WFRSSGRGEGAGKAAHGGPAAVGAQARLCHRSGGFRHPRRHLGEVDYGLRNAVEVVGENVKRDVRDDRRDVGVVVAGGADFGEVVIADAAAFRVHGQRESEGGGNPLVVGLARAVVVDLVRVDTE